MQKADHNSFVDYDDDDDEQDEDIGNHVIMYNPVAQQQEQPVVEEQVVDCFDANRECAMRACRRMCR